MLEDAAQLRHGGRPTSRPLEARPGDSSIKALGQQQHGRQACATSDLCKSRPSQATGCQACTQRFSPQAITSSTSSLGQASLSSDAAHFPARISGLLTCATVSKGGQVNRNRGKSN